MNILRLTGLTLALATVANPAARAHDTWVQTNTGVIRVEDTIHVDLLLGNHGNDHRDFKLAGKPDVAASTLDVILPDGKRIDLKDRLVDLGYAPAEGFWSARFVPEKPGLYLISHTMDKVVSYAPTRSIKSAKACFVATPSLDKVPTDFAGYDRVLGHPLELVFTRHPVTPMGPGTPIAVRLLLRASRWPAPGFHSFPAAASSPKVPIPPTNARPTPGRRQLHTDRRELLPRRGAPSGPGESGQGYEKRSTAPR